MERIRVSTLAKRLNTSATTIYKYLHRLEKLHPEHIIRDAGITFISEAGAEIIRSEILTPASAALKPQYPADSASLENRLDGMEKSILALVEEVRALRIDNSGLRSDNAALRILLEPPVVPSMPVWTPPAPRPDPIAGASWLKRFYIATFHPDRLRRFDP